MTAAVASVTARSSDTFAEVTEWDDAGERAVVFVAAMHDQVVVK